MHSRTARKTRTFDLKAAGTTNIAKLGNIHSAYRLWRFQSLLLLRKPQCLRAGIALSATGCTVRGSNPGEGEIFRTRPDRPCVPPSLLYNGYRFSFQGVKQLGRGVNHPLPSSAEVKESADLYLYSPFGPS